jgi:hypothetical protein
LIGGFNLVKRRELSDADRERVREIAIEEAIRIVEESTGIVGTVGSVIPLTRPFARATSSAVRRSANLLLKSGALDSYIDAQINMLASQRGYVISDVEKKSRADLVLDLAEAGIDILADPEVQKELDELDAASRRMGTPLPGREVVRRSGQFSRQNLLPRFETNTKRTRKKTKTDKNMKKALTQANAELRTKNGKLRKGKTQADVMRRAHRIRKKMS